MKSFNFSHIALACLAVAASLATHASPVYEFRQPKKGLNVASTKLPAAVVDTSAANLAFGAVNLGSNSAPLSFLLMNKGDASTTIDAPQVSGPFNASSNCSGTLAAGNECSVTLSFTPLAVGPAAGSVSVVTGVGTKTVTLSGMGVGLATATPSPTSLTFDSQTSPTQVGATSTQTVRLTNNGTATLALTAAPAISGNAAFSLGSPATTCGAELAIGASCDTYVKFSPSSVTPVSATLTFGTSIGNTQVSLSGTGLQASGAFAAAASSSTSYGAVAAGSSVTRTFEFKNTGTATATSVYVTLPSGNYLNFVDASTTCGTSAGTAVSVAPGASCTATVSYAPTATHTLNALLSVASSAVNSPSTLTVTGTGYISDAQLAAVKFLSGFEGTAGSTTFAADVGGTVSRTGTSASTAYLASSPVKFGNTSLALRGNGNFAYTNTSSDYYLGTSDFTLEGWVYPNVSPANGSYVMTIANGSNYGNSLFVVRGANTFGVGMACDGGCNGMAATSAASYPAGQWYHIAVTRQSGFVRLFVNGVIAATGTYAGPGKSNNRLIVNGAWDNNGFGNYGSDAYYDEIRFTLGVARYTANFTVPAAAFPRQ